MLKPELSAFLTQISFLDKVKSNEHSIKGIGRGGV